MEQPSQTTSEPCTMPCTGRLSASPDVLFAYGTLQFASVIGGLLGRIPDSTPDSAHGWRVAALKDRVYPGLVPSTADAATGLLYSDLAVREWIVLDGFEDNLYCLRRISLDSGRYGWAYIWTAQDVLPTNWCAQKFEERHLNDYVSRFSHRRDAPRPRKGEVVE